jgi:hypothetical protein
MYYRWQNVIEGFEMPIKIAGESILPSDKKWRKLKLEKNTRFELDKNYYIQYKEVQP